MSFVALGLESHDTEDQMPCRDEYAEAESDRLWRETVTNELAFNKALACACFRWAERPNGPDAGDLPETAKEFVALLDLQEAGLNRSEVLRWWKKHKEEDARKKALEEAYNKKQAQHKEHMKKRKEVLKSLTKEQRRILGV